MITDGVSCKGSYHDKNQDYFLCSSVKGGYILALSDGMGSKLYSQHGSKAICNILRREFEKENKTLENVNWISFLQKCHEEWIREVKVYDPAQCYATMLVLLVQGNTLKAARLGDGFLSVWVDDKVHILMDEKEDYFANETDCLMEAFNIDCIQTLELRFDKFVGAVACSDGIEIGVMKLDEIERFTRDFLSEYAQLTQVQMKTDISEWVSSWPGIDDKTIAYII